MADKTCDAADLIERHLQGSRVALSQLGLRYDRLGFGIAHGVVCCHEAAEDIRQEVFLQVYENLPSLRDRTKFVGWLRTITYNACYATLRRAKPTRPLDSLPECEHPTAPSSHASVEGRELRTLLRKRIDALPEGQRAVIELHYFEGLAVKQIVDFLELPETTIRWRIRKARETLRNAADINGYPN